MEDAEVVVARGPSTPQIAAAGPGAGGVGGDPSRRIGQPPWTVNVPQPPQADVPAPARARALVRAPTPDPTPARALTPAPTSVQVRAPTPGRAPVRAPTPAPGHAPVAGGQGSRDG